MRLRNKKTGEIIDFASVHREYDGANDIGLAEIGHERGDTIPIYSYRSLAEINEEWEDYEEPKQSALRVMILTLANFIENEPSDNVDLDDCKDMLKRLEAWKRLKNKGFRFDGYDVTHNSNGDLCGQLFYNAGKYCIGDVEEDLDLLFGGEE